MNSGLEGVVAADTVLSHTDGDTGTIWVRGHTVDDLVKNHGYEGTVAIIWDGFVGTGLTRAGIQRDFGHGRERTFAQMNDWLGAASKRPLLEGVGSRSRRYRKPAGRPRSRRRCRSLSPR